MPQRRDTGSSQFTFKQHPVGVAERLWLEEAAASPNFDARIAKVKLLGKIPEDFDPNTIDSRFYRYDQLTLLGLWRVDPRNAIFPALHQVISAIRGVIIANPGIASISAPELEQKTKLPQAQIWTTLGALQDLGNFFSGAQGAPDGRGIASISLNNWPVYDEYLRYKDIETLLERYYIHRDPKNLFARFPSRTNPPLGSTPPVDLYGEPFEPVRARVPLKPNSAFVLMAIDPNRPELEDVYSAIKDTCRLFGINAYRADEIQHQDRITDRILLEIESCEHLIADLSLERPNVYYEVGFAHAKNKRPILYRRSGTKLHFDLAVHNVPEYRNITELRDLLRKRLAAILGRDPTADPEQEH